MSELLNADNILVTRPAHQAEPLCDLIEQQGWHAIRFPTLEIVAVNNIKVRQQFGMMDQCHWLIFISVNAVNFALSANNGKIDCFKNCSIAAVGKSTEKALLSVGLSVDLVPEKQFNTEGLLATNEMNQIEGKKCLIIRGQGGREVLANELRKRGANMEYMEVYSRVMPTIDNMDVNRMFRQSMFYAITVTSGDALKNLVTMIGLELRSKLQAVPLIVISNRIKELAEEIGFERVVVTENPSDRDIIKAAVSMSFGTQ